MALLRDLLLLLLLKLQHFTLMNMTKNQLYLQIVSFVKFPFTTRYTFRVKTHNFFLMKVRIYLNRISC